MDTAHKHNGEQREFRHKGVHSACFQVGRVQKQGNLWVGYNPEVRVVTERMGTPRVPWRFHFIIYMPLHRYVHFVKLSWAGHFWSLYFSVYVSSKKILSSTCEKESKKEKQILTEVWRDGRAVVQVCCFHRCFVSQSFFLPQNHGLFESSNEILCFRNLLNSTDKVVTGGPPHHRQA